MATPATYRAATHRPGQRYGLWTAASRTCGNAVPLLEDVHASQLLFARARQAKYGRSHLEQACQVVNGRDQLAAESRRSHRHGLVSERDSVQYALELIVGPQTAYMHTLSTTQR
jgi:hypothetical protein